MGTALADGADLEAAPRVSTSDHVARNKAEWEVWAAEYEDAAERNWAQEEITWGIWDAPESELWVLPDVEGKDVVPMVRSMSSSWSWRSDTSC